MATLVANNAETPVSTISLLSGINAVGRAEGNHHVIPHASISSRHCEVVLDEGKMFVRDLGSTNGTFVDDNQVAHASTDSGSDLAAQSTWWKRRNCSRNRPSARCA
ncbi:MAG TPA: FHA domain-containing protein [Candidatus Limnocylindria bacterium]|nr:FHA domain-containing protein [Candidatus Limnocylindria bacterium]